MSEKSTEQMNQEARTFAAVEKMAEAMTGGIKKWEKVLFPMMIIFIVLAGYGFFLIYQLAHDVRQISSNMLIMTRAVATMTSTLNLNMQKIDAQMGAINLSMDRIYQSMDAIRQDTQIIGQIMPQLNDHFSAMNQAINTMNKKVTVLTDAADSMARSLWELDQNISEPMNSLNSIMPFGMMPKKRSKRVYNPPPTFRYPRQPVYPNHYYNPTSPGISGQIQPRLQGTTVQPAKQNEQNKE
ncbi:MAG TPA: hypothetical protein EYP05_07105 [Piscirickettsiaceae bacterium]|nr:hypothetical protein [Piscirickettsiaceae bacterium]